MKGNVLAFRNPEDKSSCIVLNVLKTWHGLNRSNKYFAKNCYQRVFASPNPGDGESNKESEK